MNKETNTPLSLENLKRIKLKIKDSISDQLAAFKHHNSDGSHCVDRILESMEYYTAQWEKFAVAAKDKELAEKDAEIAEHIKTNNNFHTRINELRDQRDSQRSIINQLESDNFNLAGNLELLDKQLSDNKVRQDEINVLMQRVSDLENANTVNHNTAVRRGNAVKDANLVLVEFNEAITKALNIEDLWLIKKFTISNGDEARALNDMWRLMKKAIDKYNELLKNQQQ